MNAIIVGVILYLFIAATVLFLATMFQELFPEVSSRLDISGGEAGYMIAIFWPLSVPLFLAGLLLIEGTSMLEKTAKRLAKVIKERNK